MYTLANIEPSNYTLVFSVDGFRTRAVGVKPRNNQTTIVNLSLIPNGGTIAGTVTNAITTLPIAGASVLIFQNSILIALETTDAGGVYTVNNLAPGIYIILAFASGFRFDLQGARVQVGMTTTADFALQPNPGTIAGQVTDALTSNPLSDALIEVFKDSILVGFDDTNLVGNYTVSSLAPGNYVVVASHEDYRSQTVGTEVFSNTVTPLNFALTLPVGTIAGAVIDANTLAPIPGALVSIYQDEILIQSLLTDIEGNYEISEFPPGDYVVVVQADDYQSAVSAATVSASATTVVNFALQPNPGAISGTVTDALTTDPIVGASVLIFLDSQLISTAVTDENGDYTFPNLAPGSYVVLVRASGYRATFSLENVIAGMTTTADFALTQNTGSIEGVITSLADGSPVPGALVVVTDGSAIVGFTLTDSEGNYIIDDLAPGNYTVSAANQRFLSNSASATVIAGAATPVNLVLTPRALSPEEISGETFSNQFLTQKDRIHFISWTASPGCCVTGYEILRNDVTIAIVSPSVLSYMDHNRQSADVYTVKTLNAFGQVSTGISIVLP